MLTIPLKNIVTGQVEEHTIDELLDEDSNGWLFEMNTDPIREMVSCAKESLKHYTNQGVINAY
jgi:hypothetical protein